MFRAPRHIRLRFLHAHEPSLTKEGGLECRDSSRRSVGVSYLQPGTVTPSLSLLAFYFEKGFRADSTSHYLVPICTEFGSIVIGQNRPGIRRIHAPIRSGIVAQPFFSTDIEVCQRGPRSKNETKHKTTSLK